MVKKVVDHLVFGVAVLVLLGGLAMLVAVAPGAVDAVNVADGGGWDAVRDALGVAVVDTLKALVVFGVGVWGFVSTRDAVGARL